MKNTITIALLLVLCGCGVEVLTTAAIQGELQAQNLKAMDRQLGHAADTTGRINLERAISTYQAETGKYPPSLDQLVPQYLQSIPVRSDGTPYGYDPSTGQLIDIPAEPLPVSSMSTVTSESVSDDQKLASLRRAVESYYTAKGRFPASLYSLVPEYIDAIPGTSAGREFVYVAQSGSVQLPAQAYGAAPGQPANTPGAMPGQGQAAQPPRQNRGGGMGGGVGPMGEMMTGIGVQNQLNSMGNSGVNAAGGYSRRSVQNSTQTHDQTQQKTMDDLGL